MARAGFFPPLSTCPHPLSCVPCLDTKAVLPVKVSWMFGKIASMRFNKTGAHLSTIISVF